jgi:opacity protein-like surface antigen
MKQAASYIAILTFLWGASAGAQSPMIDWQGPYASLGASHTRVTYSASGGYSPARASGSGVSLIAGYNFRQDALVFGPEVLANFSNIRGSSQNCGSVSNCSSNIENYLAARVRVGYLTEAALVFGAIGLAFDEQNQRVTGAIDPQKKHFGLSLGLGAEIPVLPNFAIRAELEYYRFDQKTYDLGVNAGSVKIRPSFGAARLGFSYYF